MAEVMNPVASSEGNATTTGTAAVAFPAAQPNQVNCRHFIVNNLGAVTLYFRKASVNTGPDAASSTPDASGYRFAVGAGQSHVYRRGQEEIYYYVAAASGTCAFTITVGDGE